MSSILSTIGRIVTEYRIARARYQTERTVHALPIELQKDLGWPEAGTSRPVCMHGAGNWAGSR